ncbi:response regulator [Blastococcus sp. CT_GayMR16]|uniref:response regulator n=1 Tax=Blastococcus sp. CT_GayMR16 TaxID=2559607 RepID=UPI001073E480|nr:response regulator [Blastococcus sp. CT_GayMR16]TFV86029.1 response regulator [Blastococcus sp. CT_GayMR16]
MERHDHASPSVLTALVVDDSFASRTRITMLLHLGGWRVHQAVGTEDALRLAALLQPDLVVTDMVMRQGHGATLMRRLREQGSAARFLVVAARRTHQTRALAAAAGALACLAKPVDPRLFVDVMRGLAPSALAPARADVAPQPAQEIGPQAEEMFLSALPHRLSAIAISAQAGDAAAVAVAADALGTASDRLGHAEIAFLSNSIARDARRGTVSHGRLVALVELCARLDTNSALAAQAATSR